MKKVIFLLMALMVLGISAEAQTRKKTAPKAKKTASSVLPVTKGEVKDYGDYLKTQMFTIKKGKDNKIVLEYPISGNPGLVNAMRQYIKNSLNDKFTGSLDTPEALMRNAIKGAKDVSYGQDGETLDTEFRVIYNTSEFITLKQAGSSYMGGVHGSAWDTGASFLVSDGTVFSESMLPSISKMRPYILQGLAEYFGTSTRALSNDYIFGEANDIDYPSTIYITKDGLNFIYQQYEIAPYSAGIPIAVVPVNAKIIEMLNTAGKQFFKSVSSAESAGGSGDNDNQIFTAVEQQAEFPGGQNALMKFLSANIVYPEAARLNNIQGRVIVKFVVETDGSITTPVIAKGIDKDLDREALRVVKKMPKWIPAKNNGMAVRSYFTFPITFKFSE